MAQMLTTKEKQELIYASNNIFRLDGNRDTVRNIKAKHKLDKDIIQGKVVSINEIRQRAMKYGVYN